MRVDPKFIILSSEGIIFSLLRQKKNFVNDAKPITDINAIL